MKFLCSDHGHQSRFALCHGVVNGGLQQRFGISFALVLSGNPKAVDHQVTGSIYREPCFLCGAVFYKNLRPFIESAEHVPVVKFSLQPFFFQLVAVLAFLVGKGATDVFLGNVLLG